MAFRDWFIFNRFRKQHGNQGYDAVREIFSNERFTDEDILRRYPALSNSDIAIIRLVYRVEELENKLNNTTLSENAESKPNNENHRYNNKTFIANRRIELGMGPLHEDSGWKEITAETIEGGEFN